MACHIIIVLLVAVSFFVVPNKGRTLPDSTCETVYDGLCIHGTQAADGSECDPNKYIAKNNICKNDSSVCCVPHPKSNRTGLKLETYTSWYSTCGTNKYGEIREVSSVHTTTESSIGHGHHVIGGVEARSGEIPWQVALLHDNVHVCGGAIIDNFHVVTAAHCLRCEGSFTLPECVLSGIHEVMIGGNSLKVPTQNTRRVFVQEAFVHEDYIGTSSTMYDIAVLKLSSSIADDIANNEDVNPICSPQSEVDYYSAVCFMSGWGKTGYPVGPKPDNLHYVQLMSMDRHDCCLHHCSGSCNSANCNIYSYNICANYPGGGKDACTGDSGGPLVCQVDGRYDLVGISSWGDMCAEETSPSVYVNVVSFMDWIETVTGSSF